MDGSKEVPVERWVWAVLVALLALAGLARPAPAGSRPTTPDPSAPNGHVDVVDAEPSYGRVDPGR